MIDWNKRREELKQQDFEYDFDSVSEDEYYDRLISQEKEMIREFAKDIVQGKWIKISDFAHINKLLKSMEIEEI